MARFVQILWVACLWLTSNVQAQDFLSRYTRVTTENVDSFFVDWASYSRQFASMCDTLPRALNEVYANEMLVKPRNAPGRFWVLPDEVKVYEIKKKFNPNSGNRIKADSTQAYTIFTPVLKGADSVLYRTKSIVQLLRDFVKPARTSDIAKRDLTPITMLKRYIEFDDHFLNRYFQIPTEPWIGPIYVFNNGILMECEYAYSGYVIWYELKKGKYERTSKPYTWMY